MQFFKTGTVPVELDLRVPTRCINCKCTVHTVYYIHKFQEEFDVSTSDCIRISRYFEIRI